MTAKLHALPGGGEPHADACGACVFYRREKYTVIPRCDAFGGAYADEVRAQHRVRCPGYVGRRPKAPVAAREPGWLLRLLRWFW
jgi:hypothetical protein